MEIGGEIVKNLQSEAHLLFGTNDIEVPKALDVQLALPERGKFFLAAILNGGKRSFASTEPLYISKK